MVAGPGLGSERVSVRPSSPIDVAAAAPRATIEDEDGRGAGDDDVIRLLAQGARPAAFQTLVKRHGCALHRFCQVMLKGADLADDVEQQILLEAYLRLDRLQPGIPVRAWLFTLARHRVVDAVRRRQRQPMCISLGELIETPSLQAQPTTAHAYQMMRIRGALNACIAKLSEDTQTLLVMRYEQGLSFDEMSSRLGAPAGTLQRRVARALPRLRVDLARMLRRAPEHAAFQR
jgi:RNA polymerase sigma-70 factor (ECF subfamily)